MKIRPVELKTPPEKCERGCGQLVAVTRRIDDGATRLSTVSENGSVQPGPHNAIYHDEEDNR